MKVSINFNTRLDTYVAQDAFGVVHSIYCPREHGTVEEFRNFVARTI